MFGFVGDARHDHFVRVGSSGGLRGQVDGSNTIRFCYTVHSGQFGRSPQLVQLIQLSVSHVNILIFRVRIYIKFIL